MKYYTVLAYKNKINGDLVFNCTALNTFGIKASTKYLEMITSPYSIEYVGTKLMESFHLCMKEPNWNKEISGSVSVALGYKNYKKFLNDFLHVSINWSVDEDILEIEPMGNDGKSYVGINKKIMFKSLADRREIGQCLVNAFSECR